MKFLLNTLHLPKKIFFIIVLGIFVSQIFQSCNAVKQADKAAARNTITAYYPDTEIDTVTAKAALAEGNSLVKGVLFTRVKNKLGFKAPLAPKIYGVGETVTLFPVTSYFEDWYQMRKERENKNSRIYMSDEAFKYKLTTKTDEYGRFKFEKMRPGKYFLQAVFAIDIPYVRQVYTGSGSNGYATTNYYENERYYVQQAERIEKYIEIKENGEILEVKLK
jgi:hypothetical protein